VDTGRGMDNPNPVHNGLPGNPILILTLRCLRCNRVIRDMSMTLESRCPLLKTPRIQAGLLHLLLAVKEAGKRPAALSG